MGVAGRTLRRADAAFWIVLALAIGVGGESALEGLPKLAGLLMPGGFTAEAHTQPKADFVTLPLFDLAPSPVAQQTAVSGGSGSGSTMMRRLPAIAIVIDDMGSDPAIARRAFALPSAVALSFLPYPVATPALAREGARAGHDILVHVPMQAESRDENPGPMALLVGLPRDEIVRRLDWALSRVPGFIGINNHMGSLYTQDRAALVPVAEALVDRHVFFFDSRTAANSQVVPVARAFGVPSASRDVFLDDVQTVGDVGGQLAQLERDARAGGVAIAIGHPHAVTLDVLARWCAGPKGYRLVPIGVAIKMKTEREMGVSVANRE